MENLERIHRNLYRSNGHYYRLYGHGVTPNGCWIIAPEFREIIDIDIATGKDVFGHGVHRLDTGEISASGRDFVTA